MDASDDGTRLNNNNGKLLTEKNDTNGNLPNGSQQEPPPVPPRSFEKNFDDNFINNRPIGSTRVVENKPDNQISIDEFDEDFNPRAYETAANGFHHNNILNGKSTSPFPTINESLTPPLCKFKFLITIMKGNLFVNIY